MATLDPPFDGLSIGKHKLQISLLGWHDVGECEVKVNDKFHFSATGNFNALGHKGTFDMQLALTDKNPTSPTGPCTVSNGGQAFNGTYIRSGSTITFSDGQHNISASPDGKNVLLVVSGYPKARILA